MHRILGLLVLTAVGLGVYLLFSGPDFSGPNAGPIGAAPQAAERAPLGYSGLAMGLVLAWIAGIEWSTLPERVSFWLRLQRRRIGLAILGGLFTAVLLLF